MQVTKKSLKLSIEQITWLCRRSKFEGFMGAQCGGCRKTVNLVMTACWTCICGHRNVLLTKERKLPYEKPDLGPTSNEIHLGLMNADDARLGR